MLAKTGLIHKLNTAYKNIVIPYGVSEEILEGGDDEAVRWIKGGGKKYVINFSKVKPVVAAWDLGKGESQVISYTYTHSELRAGLDDKAARKCAKALSIKLIGTIGLILYFKKTIK